MGLFAVNFFLYRIFITPFLWYEIISTVIEYRNDPTSQKCLPWHMTYMILAFGIFFHCLNAFWGYKIIKKIQRKLSGKEKVKEQNSLKDK